jgi:5-methylthioadenosine/S-adenosylhomocysteine deaminase
MRDQYFAAGTYGRLRMGMALRGPCFTSAERNAEDYAFARDLGLPISVHVGMAGTAGAITDLQRDRLLGAEVNYVHGNMLTDREFDLIAESRGTLTITPSTDMLMQFGTFPATGPALSRRRRQARWQTHRRQPQPRPRIDARRPAAPARLMSRCGHR